MLLELIFIYIVFVILTIVINYYSTLIMEKLEYTRDDLKQVFSYIQNVLEVLLKRYSLPIFLLSSLTAIILTVITSIQVLNSSLLFILIFILLPLIKKHLEKTNTTDQSGHFTRITDFILKYSNMIIAGFGFGSGSALIYSWAASRTITFLWFAGNIAIIVFLLQLNLKRLMSK